MNYKLIVIIAILILVGAGFLLFKGQSMAPLENEVQNIIDESTSTSTATSTDAEATVKEFTVDGKNFSFSPSNITVNNGDTVKITFNNTGGTHNLTIDEFNASTRTIQAGQSDTVTFVADKTGVFEYYCSVGSHRTNGMVGTFTVR